VTVAVAWVGKRRNGRDHLYIASDSRVTGGHTMDSCPKILTLPRGDSALCFAGSTDAAYPLMLQVVNAIAAHRPSRDRTMDLTKLKAHVLRLCSDLIERFRGAPVPLKDREVQFLLAGYSWLTGDFEIWTIQYRAAKSGFVVHHARSFHDRLRKAEFIGDRGPDLQRLVLRELQGADRHWDLEPVRVLAVMLSTAPAGATIGGPPQVIRIDKSMNTRNFCVRWRGELTIYGRPLFDYESVDYRILDPMTGVIKMPPPFGRGRRPPEDPGVPSAPVV
jgi:hypothetical protein